MRASGRAEMTLGLRITTVTTFNARPLAGVVVVMYVSTRYGLWSAPVTERLGLHSFGIGEPVHVVVTSLVVEFGHPEPSAESHLYVLSTVPSVVESSPIAA